MFLSSGIRWLLTRGNKMEAKQILLHAAKINNTSISQASLAELDKKNIALKDDEENDVVISDDEIRSSKMKKRMILQLVVISYLWFSTIFVYYGLNINSVYLEYWNKYYNFIVRIHNINLYFF
jgi:hypothetical protein